MRARPKVLTVILAGGKGSRLESLTDVRAKPAVPVAGLYRLIDFPLSNAMHSCLNDVWIIVQYQPHALAEHLANGRPWDLDRTYGGLKLLPPYEAETDDGGFAQGNADALYRNRNLLRAHGADLLLVLSADHLYTLDYRTVIDRHLDTGAELTMVTAEVPTGEASRFGNVRVGRDGRVKTFAYKPKKPLGSTVTAEIFLYDAAVLLDTLDELAAQPDADGGTALRDYGDRLLPRLVERGNSWAMDIGGYWRDVGTLDSYWAAHRDLLPPEPKFVLDDAIWPILTYGAQRLPARLHDGCRVVDSLVSPGCTIRGTVIRSTLAPGVTVETGAVVRDSVVLHDVVIETGAVVGLSILDSRSRIGADARVGRLARTAPKAPTADELTVVGRGAHIAAGLVVAPGSRIDPVGDHPEGGAQHGG